MIVAFGTLGSAVKFTPKNIRRWDGSVEYIKMLKFLCSIENVDKVLFLSKSDYKKAPPEFIREIDPLGKIVDCWKDSKTFCPTVSKLKDSNGKTNQKKARQFVSEYGKMLDAIEDEEGKADVGFFYVAQGYSSTVCIPDYVACSSNKKIGENVKPLLMSITFAASTLHYVNSRPNLPWFALSTDPRYFSGTNIHIRDTINLPRELVGQFNIDFNWKHIPYPYDYENDKPRLLAEEITDPIKMTYSGIEKVTSCFENVILANTEKSRKFLICSMEVDTGLPPDKDYRLNELKEWLLNEDVNKEIEVYGKWKKEKTDGYPQFKGYVESDELLDRMFEETRYTLVMPTKAGWVTSKYCEMLRTGVIPFFHPNYDKQNSVLPINHFLRVSSPTDLKEKMDMLDQNPIKRIKLIELLRKQILPDMEKGEPIRQCLNAAMERARIGWSFNEYEDYVTDSNFISLEDL